MSERRHAKAKATSRWASAARPKGRPTAPSGARRPGASSRVPTKAPAKIRRPSILRKSPAPARKTATSRPKASRPAGTKRSDREAAETRRKRIPVALGAAAAAVILVTSFPLSVLLGQHRQLSAEAAQLSSMKHQNGLLAEQRQQLSTNAEVKRLARQNYQLVEPGQALYDILPPAGTTTPSTPGAPTAGDPAGQPLVSPSQAPNMSPDPGLPATTVPTSSGSAGTSSVSSTPSKPVGGFWSRVGSTLQFWK